jgi:hypothetical protein
MAIKGTVQNPDSWYQEPAVLLKMQVQWVNRISISNIPVISDASLLRKIWERNFVTMYRILILSDNYHLLLPATTPRMHSCSTNCSSHWYDKPTGRANWRLLHKTMTLYNYVRLLQMKEHMGLNWYQPITFFRRNAFVMKDTNIQHGLSHQRPFIHITC